MNDYLSLFLLLTLMSVTACAPAPETTKLTKLGSPASQSAAAQEKLPTTELMTKPSPFPPLPRIGTRKLGDDWADFLGPARNGKSNESGYRPDEAPRVLWRRKFGEGYSIGAVACGRYFQFYREADEIVLECVKAETGETLWTYKNETHYTDRYGYNGGPRSNPVIDVEADLAFVYGPDGVLVAIRASTGEEIWKVDTLAQYSVVPNFFGVGSTPLIDGERLIVIVGGTKLGPQRNVDFMLQEPNGSAIVAFDKRTGKQVYKMGEELASYSSPIITNVGGKRVGLAFVRGGLLGFDPEDGRSRFHFPWRAKIMESVNAATPVIDGSRVLISECYGPGSAFLDITESEPNPIWQDDPKKRERKLKAHWNTPIVHGGHLYASSGRHTGDAELRCLELETGKVKWSEPGLTRCSMTYLDNHLLCQCEDGRILVLKANPEKFEQICEVKLEQPLHYPTWSAPVVSHGLGYFRDEAWTVCVELIPQ